MPGTRRTRDELLVYKDQDPLGRYAEFQNPRTDMPILSPGTAETNGSIHNLGDQQLALRQGLDAIAQLEQGLGNIQNPLQRPTGTPDEQRALFANAFQQGGVTPNGSPSHPLFGDQPQPGMFDGLAMRLQNAHAIGQGTLPFWMQMQQAQQGMLDNQQMMQLKRQQLQQQLEQQKVSQVNNQWKQIFDVLGNKDISSYRSAKILEGLGQTNPVASQFAEALNAKNIARFRQYQDKMSRPPEEYAQGLRDGSMTIDDVMADLDSTQEREQLLAKDRAEQSAMQGLIDRYDKGEQLSLTDKTKLKEYFSKSSKLDEELAQLRMGTQLKQNELTRSGIDTAATQVLPQAGPQIALPNGQVRQDIFDPQAGGRQTFIGEKKPLVEVSNKQESAEAQAVGKAMGEQFNTIQKSGLQAQGKLAKLDRMEQLLQGVKTGGLIPTFTQMENIAETFGVKLDKTLGAKQAFTALAGEVALTLRNTGEGNGMPGQLSDKDREFLVAMTPNLAQTPEGNKLIIETARKLTKREIQIAKLASDYRKKHGSLDPGFYEEAQKYADAHPLFASSPSSPGPQPNEFVETRTTKDGRRLGKTRDGRIVEIK